MIRFIKIIYISIFKYLIIFFKIQEIIYNLLWMFFKLNLLIYIICFSIHKPKCVKYKCDKERTINNKAEYFYIKYYYLNFNDKVFEKTLVKLAIPKFYKTMKINSLNIFFINCYSSRNKILIYFIHCSQKFVSLISVHHYKY